MKMFPRQKSQMRTEFSTKSVIFIRLVHALKSRYKQILVDSGFDFCVIYSKSTQFLCQIARRLQSNNNHFQLRRISTFQMNKCLDQY